MEALGQVLIGFAVIAIAVAATVKLRSKMRESQMYAGDYPPFGDEVIPEDLVQPLARMETNVNIEENQGRVLRLESDSFSTLSTGNPNGSSVSFVTEAPAEPEYRIKKLDTAKKTRAVVKKKVAPKKATSSKSKRTTRKVRT